MTSVDEVHRKLGFLSAITKVCFLCGISSFGLAFFSKRFNFSAAGFVLVGFGLALLFLRDAFRPRTKLDNNGNVGGDSMDKP
jgi:hypothetical protein